MTATPELFLALPFETYTAAKWLLFALALCVLSEYLRRCIRKQFGPLQRYSRLSRRGREEQQQQHAQARLTRKQNVANGVPIASGVLVCEATVVSVAPPVEVTTMH